MKTGKRTIGILHYSGPPYVGGVEQTVGAHAKFLAGCGFAVRIVAGQVKEVGDGVHVQAIEDLGSRGATIEAVNADLARGQLGQAFEPLVDRIRSQLIRELGDADALIVHNALTMHKNLALTAALFRMNLSGSLPPLVAWCHDFAWTDSVYEGELHEGWPWDLLRTAWPNVRYVVVSGDRQRELSCLLEIAREDIGVIPPGIDVADLLKLDEETVRLVDSLQLLSAHPLLLLPARVTRRKNIRFAIEVVGRLFEHGFSPKLVVTGPPGPHNPLNASHLEDLIRFAEASSPPGSVTFLHRYLTDVSGPVPDVRPAVVADLYGLADGLLFPSRAEGFGIPVLEAAMRGLPIFRSNIPVLREVAPDVAVAFGLDEPPEQVAQRIADFFHQDRRYDLKRKVRLNYTWSGIGNRLLLPLIDEVVRV